MNQQVLDQFVRETLAQGRVFTPTLSAILRDLLTLETKRERQETKYGL